MNQNRNIPIESSKLEASNGLSVVTHNLGATLQSIRVPTDKGPVEVVLGYPDPEDYRDDPYFMGSTVGRYAGRLDSGRLKLAGKVYELDRNDSEYGHCLHGGSGGFHSKYWEVDEDPNSNAVLYRMVSPDGDQGFPGRMTVTVRYSLVSRMVLQVDYFAESESDTVVNLTNHAYFNLNGDGSGIDNHEVWINSELFLPMGPDMLPNGDISHVQGSVFDFREKAVIGERLAMRSSQLGLTGGFDHFFLLNKAMKYPAIAATLTSPKTGIRVKFYSSRPGVQFYTGNSLAEPFGRRTGVCLEFQNAPNAPNVAGFPSPLLKAGHLWHRQLVMEFEV
ncbi:MAG: aldose epimerase family protein [Lysobacterales bacterium]|jgi:aldose 1-epimerase